MKTIHFICSGNIYRSRMAEAYFNSLNIPNIEAISSGTLVDTVEHLPIDWYAARIIHNNNLVRGMSRDSKKTTKEMLEKSDFVIFMQQEHFDYCKDTLNYVPDFYQVWDIHDMGREPNDEYIIERSEKTFDLIKNNVDKLVKELL